MLDTASNHQQPDGAKVPDANGYNEADVRELTPEEQMDPFEEKLKEDDWGHQPC